jgi:hypothetical protein
MESQMANQKTLGIIYLISSIICLIAYTIPRTDTSLLVAGLFTAIILYLTVIMCFKNGKMGKFTPVVNIVFVLFTLGITGSIILKDVTGNYILGFTPGAACVIYLIWIVPFVLDYSYMKFYPSLLSEEELAEYKEEGGNV